MRIDSKLSLDIHQFHLPCMVAYLMMSLILLEVKHFRNKIQIPTTYTIQDYLSFLTFLETFISVNMILERNHCYNEHLPLLLSLLD